MPRRFTALLISLVVFAAAARAETTIPRLYSIFPCGGKAGTSAEVQIASEKPNEYFQFGCWFVAVSKVLPKPSFCVTRGSLEISGWKDSRWLYDRLFLSVALPGKRIDSGDQRTGEVREQSTGFSESASATVRLDKLFAELAFQGMYLFADGRLRQAQGVGRSRKTTEPGGLAKTAQLLKP